MENWSVNCEDSVNLWAKVRAIWGEFATAIDLMETGYLQTYKQFS